MFAILLPFLLLLAAPVRAADPFASLKPLTGTWLVDRDCKVFHDKIILVFSRLEKTVLVEFRSPKSPEKTWGKADIVYDGQEDHYFVFTSIPDNPITKSLGIDKIQGNLSVSDDPDEQGGPGHDYLTCSSNISAMTSLLAVKLKNHYKKATFTFNVNSPIGGQRCTGTGVKQPAAKAVAPTKTVTRSAIND